MELTWLPDTPQSRGRTRALLACPTCQRRKKRCRHLTPNPEYLNGPLASPRGARDRVLTARPAGGGSSSFSNTERFVGDLNPEAVIREKLEEPTGNPIRDRIGLWIGSSATQDVGGARENRQVTGTDALAPLPQRPNLDSRDAAFVLQRRYAAAMQACARLPVTTRESLTTIYFAKINRIVPLVDKDHFTQSQPEGSSSTFLERAICLVAAKDGAAASYLRLEERGSVMNPRQFCSEVYKGLVAAMDAELEPDRVTRIRVLALMSLHCEGYEGAEAASFHLCQAIHQAQTVGLHLDRPDWALAAPLAKLFWCLWTLDKMHASIGGRPVLMADRDIGLEKPDVHDQKPRGAFSVWLAVSDLLATVISFYRPSASVTSGWEEGFPAFEDVVGENAQEDLDFATLGFLELFYHCVSILSCRHKLTESLDGGRVSSIRQGLAAVRIHSIVASECADSLPPLPIVPYAIALSMGVSYRQLRSSKLITHFDRAKASLEACCSLLENLSPRWYSAEAMARLGRKALQEIDREHSLTQPAVGAVPTGSMHAESANANERETHGDPEDAAGISTDSPVSSMADLDTTMHGFADIDTLFGEFFDLSLPTNFWDPIFAEEEPSGSH